MISDSETHVGISEQEWCAHAESARRSAFITAIRAGNSSEDADEAANDALLETWKNRHLLHQGQGFEGLAAVLGRRRAIDTHRRTLRSSTMELGHALSDSSTPSPEVALLKKEVLRELIGAVNKLPQRQRSIFILWARGATQIRTAAILNEPLGTIKSSTLRGRVRLRKDLEIANAE